MTGGATQTLGPLEGLAHGFGVAFTLESLLACVTGVLVGTVVGILPGIGPTGAMALLLPVTFTMSPAAAVIMLAGIYYGSMYGGSTTAILVNVPGEAATVVTTLDGYQMTKQGRAGAALAVSAVGSFVAGTFGVVGIVFFASWLADFALNFGPPEYFALALAGLMLLSGLTGGSVARCLVMVGAGLVIGTVGMEQTSGSVRFTFGYGPLAQGIDLIPVVMGLYGVAEVLLIVESGVGKASILKVPFRELFPTTAEWRASAAPMLRGSVIGFFTGLLPGPSTMIASFLSYACERRLSRTPERFGRGAIEGVAGPEAANNSATSGAMVPILSLGIPFSPATGVLLGALVIHGIQPGPTLITQRPDVFWGFVASMYVGNLLLLILNLPLVGVFVSLLRIPQRFLATLVLLLCLLGAYSLNNSVLDVWVLIIAGIVGYFLRKASFDVAPLIVALVLGPMMERTLNQSLALLQGEWWRMFARPLTLTLFVLGLMSLLLPLIRRLRARNAAGASPSSALS